MTFNSFKLKIYNIKFLFIFILVQFSLVNCANTNFNKKNIKLLKLTSILLGALKVAYSQNCNNLCDVVAGDCLVNMGDCGGDDCCFCNCAGNKCVLNCGVSVEPCSSYITENECIQGEAECYFEPNSGCCLNNVCFFAVPSTSTTTSTTTTTIKLPQCNNVNQNFK